MKDLVKNWMAACKTKSQIDISLYAIVAFIANIVSICGILVKC